MAACCGLDGPNLGLCVWTEEKRLLIKARWHCFTLCPWTATREARFGVEGQANPIRGRIPSRFCVRCEPHRHCFMSIHMIPLAGGRHPWPPECEEQFLVWFPFGWQPETRTAAGRGPGLGRLETQFALDLL
jgi:hypothetical protein